MKTAIATRNAQLDALTALLPNGYLRIYSGAQPATPETAVSGTLLAELRFGATPFAAATGGTATANAITSDASADATGTAGYFRALKSDGTTAVYDGSVGTSASDLNLATTSIVAAATVSISSLVITLPQ
jgi:hypothetical protein